MRLDGHIRKIIDKREKLQEKENNKNVIIHKEDFKMPKELSLNKIILGKFKIMADSKTIKFDGPMQIPTIFLNDSIVPMKKFVSLGDESSKFKKLYVENAHMTNLMLEDSKKGDISNAYPQVCDKKNVNILPLNIMMINDIKQLDKRVDNLLKKKDSDIVLDSINVKIDCDRFAPVIDSFTDLGSSDKIFNNIYASQGVIENADKKEYKETRTGFGLDWLTTVKTIGYRSNGKRWHQGIDPTSIDSSIFAGKIITDQNREFLRYSEFIGPIIKSIQQLSEKIDKLEKRPIASAPMIPSSPTIPKAPSPRLNRQYTTNSLSASRSDTQDYMDLKRQSDKQDEKIKFLMNKIKDFEHLLNI